MNQRSERPPFRRRHALALRGAMLVVALSLPSVLYVSARAGNQPALWVLIAMLALVMGLAASVT